jgi:hypothetical protein
MDLWRTRRSSDPTISWRLDVDNIGGHSEMKYDSCPLGRRTSGENGVKTECRVLCAQKLKGMDLIGSMKSREWI